MAMALGLLALGGGVWLVVDRGHREQVERASDGAGNSAPGGTGAAGTATAQRLPPPRLADTSGTTAERPSFSETGKHIEVHEARRQKARDAFVAKLDAKGAAKYDAFVLALNARFDESVRPLIEAALTETEPTKRALLGKRAKEEGLVPLVQDARKQSEAIGPGAPPPLAMLDYPNTRQWAGWMREFAGTVTSDGKVLRGGSALPPDYAARRAAARDHYRATGDKETALKMARGEQPAPK